MFPERSLLHEELNACKRIVVKETCVIIVAKVVWFSQTIVTHFTGFPRVDARCVGHFVQPFEYSVGRSEVADGSHCRVSESSLIAALLKLCLTHQCANRYSSSHENRDNRSLSSSKISQYSLLTGLPARWLSKCGVPQIRVRTGVCSGLIHTFSVSASVSLESSSEG